MKGDPSAFALFKSEWGRGPEAANLHKAFPIPVQYRERNMLAVKPGSLAEKKPELENILDDINTYMVFPQQFELRMKEAGQEVQTAATLQEFYLNRLEIFQSGINAYSVIAAKADPQLGFAIKAKINTEAELIKIAVTEKVKTMNYGYYRSFLESQVTWMKAKLTELNALGAIPGIRGYSVRMGETSEMNLAIKSMVTDQKARLSKFPNHLAYLNETYPLIMNNAYIKSLQARSGRPLNPEEIIEAVGRWIRDKEIDVVYVADGKTHWLEVKLSSNQMSLDKFNELKGNKSYATQTGENIEIIRLLGIQNRTIIDFYASNGVSTHLKKFLEAKSVQVLE